MPENSSTVVLDEKSGGGSRGNHSQSGHNNRQYNAHSININEGREHQFTDIARWLSSSDPWSNHAIAHQQREAETGTWLLKSEQYKRWRNDDTRMLWMHGKAGCGKTVLCSTVIEDVKKYSEIEDCCFAIFYFTFSDQHKQSYDDLLRSLVTQLGWHGPTPALLRQACEKQRTLSPDEFEEILCSLVNAHHHTYITIDALDECPKENGIRQKVLEGLQRLFLRTAKIKLLVTSRQVEDIRLSMEELKCDQISLMGRIVDPDIRKYLSTRLSNDYRLCALRQDLKIVIETGIAQKAEGMFRYAALQLQEIAKLGSHKPSRIHTALRRLPMSLDETYARMLANIDHDERKDAVALLRWLSFSESPPSLGELREVLVIDVEKEAVDVDDRGQIEDTLQILNGLVITITDGDIGYVDGQEFEYNRFRPSADQNSSSHRMITSSTKIRLAHFSVKEYLTSSSPLHHSIQDFHLDFATGHFLINKSCLIYLNHYGGSSERTSSSKDFTAFPLLEYAAKSWYHHALQHKTADVDFETSFLLSNLKHWLMIHKPDQSWVPSFRYESEIVPDRGLYYASYTGLLSVVRLLLEHGANINAEGGYCGNALQAASYEGHIEIVKLLLLEHGANVNAEGGQYGNALQAASVRGHIDVVRLLLEHGANVNAAGGYYGNTFQAASYEGHIEIVKLLLEHGADSNAEGGHYGNALRAASYRGHIEIVKLLLLKHGANVNAQGGQYGNALQAASMRGHIEVVKLLLLDHGANVNAVGGQYGNALQAASVRGQVDVVRLLLEHGANINAKGLYGSALQVALKMGRTELVELLKERGAVM